MVEPYHSAARKGHSELYNQGYDRIFGKKRNPSKDQVPGGWKTKWESGSHEKKIEVNRITGEVRNIRYTEKDRQEIKDGSTLQPIGNQRDAFLERWKHLPGIPVEETDKYLLQKGKIRLKEFEQRKYERQNNE